MAFPVFPDLSEYEKQETSDIIRIHDSTIQPHGAGVLNINIRLKKDISILEHSTKIVETNVNIDGPIYSFSMFIKKDTHLPISGVLVKTTGFVSPHEIGDLCLEIKNNLNHEIR